MANKIIMLTGLSGSGKSTLAGNIASGNSSEVISLSQVLRDKSKEEGFSSAFSYIACRGFHSGLSSIHDNVLSSIAKKLHITDVVVDELFDYGLFKKTAEDFGRAVIVLISLEANLPKRLRRNYLRGTSTWQMLRGDVAKSLGGVRRVMTEADVVLCEPSAEKTFSEYKKAVSPGMTGPGQAKPALGGQMRYPALGRLALK